MHRFPLRAATLLVAIWFAPVPLPAQSAAQRLELERFRDSLAGQQDVAALRAIEVDLIGRARQDRANALLHLRLGFLALRLGELTTGSEASRHFDDAGGEFEWATQEQPNWPYGWYGLGFAELALGDSEVALVSGLQTMVGKDALTRSANAFARSAEVDPGFVAGLVELSSTALRQRVNLRMDVALAALRRASRTRSANSPDLLLSRGRIERAVGSLDSSAAALGRILQRDTTNTVARYELARTRFLQGDRTALPLWYGALARADSTALALYRDDLSMLMPDSLLDRLAGASGTERVELVRGFWQARDDDDLHTRGARLTEHYRRLDYARRNYRLVSERRRFGIVERYRSHQTEYDDRGVIYLRHGEPDERVRYAAPGIEPNESWLYRRDSGNLLFHFVARDDVQDFRLVESLFDVLDFATALSLRGGDGLTEAGQEDELRRHTEALLRSREGLDPVYSRLVAAGRGGMASLMTEERRLGQRAIGAGTNSDSWPLDLGEPIDASLMAVAVGADSAGTKVQLAFALPGNEMVPRQLAEGGFGYPVRLRATVLTLDGTAVARIDTTRMFRTATPIEGRRQLLGRLPIAVPAGTYTIRLAVQTDRQGAVSARDTIVVSALEGAGPQLSDLAFGTRSVLLSWPVADGDTAWINPTGIFRRDQPALLYFEVTGMGEGESYELTLNVRRPRGGSIFRRIFGGGGSAIRLTSQQRHPGGIDRVVRELALDRLSPGAYDLEVTVQDAAGRESVRSQPFRVVE